MQEIILSDFKTKIPLVEWQKQHGYTGGRVAKYIDLITDNITSDGGELHLSATILDVFDKLRERYGKPIKITSGYRTEAHQKRLIAEGFLAAKTSPHCRGYALDVDIPNETEGIKLLGLLREIRREYDGRIRIGWKKYWKYKQTLIHIDDAPLAYQALKDSSFPMVWKMKNYEW